MPFDMDHATELLTAFAEAEKRYGEATKAVEDAREALAAAEAELTAAAEAMAAAHDALRGAIPPLGAAAPEPRRNGKVNVFAHPDVRRFEGQLIGDVIRVMATKDHPVHREELLIEVQAEAMKSGRGKTLDSVNSAIKRASAAKLLEAPERGYWQLAPHLRT